MEEVPIDDPPKPKDTSVEDLLTKFDRATTDWKKWNSAAKYWEVPSFPAPTQVWLDLCPYKKKATQGFLKMDFEKGKWNLTLKDGWRDIQKLYPLDGTTINAKHPFGDRLSTAMFKDKDIMFGTTNSKAFKCLMAFSRTDPSAIPGVTCKDGATIILSSVISELWIAGNNLFGSNTQEAERPTVFDSDLAILLITNEWTKRDTAAVLGFTQETLFIEGEDGAHDFCRKVKNKMLKNGHTTSHWTQMFQKISQKEGDPNEDENNAMYLAVKMAKTDPKIFDGWKDNKLDETEITAAWAGAYTASSVQRGPLGCVFQKNLPSARLSKPPSTNPWIKRTKSRLPKPPRRHCRPTRIMWSRRHLWLQSSRARKRPGLTART
jgi:hypothetical protein